MTSAAHRNARWIPLVATIALIALGAVLGNWQLHRAAEKRALKQAYAERGREPPVQVPAIAADPAELELRKVEVRGRFEPKLAVYVDNRVYRGGAGYHVIMPVSIAASGRYVLVNRGWIAALPGRREAPPVATPAGEVTVTGTAIVPSTRFVELSTKVAEGNIWQNLVLERYRQATQIEIQPFVIQQESSLDDGLVRDWPAPDFGIEKHYGYAFQWFALSLTTFIYYVVAHVRKRNQEIKQA